MPLTPYVNQAMVNQHMNGHPAQPRGAPAGMGNPPQQQIPPVGTPMCPPNAQPAPLPTFQNSPVDTRTKSKNGQGVKGPRANQQTNRTPSVGDVSNLDTSNAIVPCHRSVSSVDGKATFHITARNRTTGTLRQIFQHRLQWTISSPISGTTASTVGVYINPQHVQQRLGYTRLQPTRRGHCNQVLWVQVRIIQMYFLPSVRRMACQPLETHHPHW